QLQNPIIRLAGSPNCWIAARSSSFAASPTRQCCRICRAPIAPFANTPAPCPARPTLLPGVGVPTSACAPRRAETRLLDRSRGADPLRDRRAALPGSEGEEVLVGEARYLDLDVDPVEKGPGDAGEERSAYPRSGWRRSGRRSRSRHGPGPRSGRR